MCDGIPLFANNKKVLMGVGTTSHSTAAEKLKISEDDYRKYEYHWWDKELVADHYDDEAEKILKAIDKDKAFKLVEKYVKSKLSRQIQIVAWLKKTPDEWGRLMKPEFRTLAKKVNPKLLFYEKKIRNFKVSSKTNPYKATKLPTLKSLKKAMPTAVWDQIGDQVGDQIGEQVGDQVWDQVGDQVGDQVWDQIWDQIGDQVGDQVWDQIVDQVWDQVWDQIWDEIGDQVGDQVWDQIGDQVWDQVWDQIGDQVWATSYWAVKITLGLPIKHWFFDFLKLGVMILFVSGKVKVFGKKGKFLGEYDEEEF